VCKVFRGLRDSRVHRDRRAYPGQKVKKAIRVIPGPRDNRAHRGRRARKARPVQKVIKGKRVPPERMALPCDLCRRTAL
jgi:hypothetical protein